MSQENEVRPRMWPAVVIAVVGVAVELGFKQWGSTNFDSVKGNAATPLVMTIVALLWWLVFSKVPWRDRFIGLALFLVAGAAVLFSQGGDRYKGGIFLAGALPFLTAGSILVLTLAAVFPWPVRRVLAAGYLAVCVVVFSMMHVVTVASDFTAVTQWRWEQHAASGAAPTTAAVHGTAQVPAQAGANDWPGFRGPNRDASVPGTFATNWSTPPKQLWKRPVGAGHSSMAVVGDYLFTLEQQGGDELVSCYSAKTGEPVWTNAVKAKHDDAMGGEGPRSTPTFANGKIYAQSAGGLLQCLDASTGTVVWKQEMTTKDAPNPPMYGFSSSPLVLGDLVIAYADGAGRHDLVAFNAATGAEVWSAAKGTGGYSSPQLFTLEGVPQVLLLNSVGLQSFTPDKGTQLWQYEFKQKQFPRCVQPLHDGKGGFALGLTTDFGSKLARVTKSGDTWTAKEEWSNEKHRPYFNDDVGHKGAMYGFDGNRLCCVELATGETKWQGTRYGGQVMILPDMDLVLVLTEKGRVQLVKADPAAFTEVSGFDAITGKTWNHPAIANGKIYVRNSEEMACYDLAGKG